MQALSACGHVTAGKMEQAPAARDLFAPRLRAACTRPGQSRRAADPPRESFMPNRRMGPSYRRHFTCALAASRKKTIALAPLYGAAIKSNSISRGSDT